MGNPYWWNEPYTSIAKITQPQKKIKVIAKYPVIGIQLLLSNSPKQEKNLELHDHVQI